MSISEIIELIGLIITTIGLISTLFVAITKGHLKEFIVKKMEEAEELFKNEEDKAIKKLEFVINAVKEKYKIISIILNIKKFIEKVVDITKKINYNKGE